MTAQVAFSSRREFLGCLARPNTIVDLAPRNHLRTDFGDVIPSFVEIDFIAAYSDSHSARDSITILTGLLQLMRILRLVQWPSDAVCWVGGWRSSFCAVPGRSAVRGVRVPTVSR